MLNHVFLSLFRIGWYNLFILMLITAVGFYFCSFSQTGRKDSNTYHRQFKLWTNGIGYFYGMMPLLHRFGIRTTTLSTFLMVLHLSQMLYALRLSYHSNTEAILFAYLSSGWSTTTVDRLAPR